MNKKLDGLDVLEALDVLEGWRAGKNRASRKNRASGKKMEQTWIGNVYGKAEHEGKAGGGAMVVYLYKRMEK